MFQKKHLSIVIFAILCVTCVWAEEQQLRTIRTRNPETEKIMTKQVPIPTKEADPYEDTSILIEAFVVQVSAEALNEAGVSPIGQSPEGVSILKLLWCLKDAEGAEVVSGAKVNCCHRQEAETGTHQRHYVARKQVNTRRGPDGPIQIENVTYDEYQSGLKFECRGIVLENKKVSVKYSFSISDFDENEDPTVPPATYSRDWQGILTAASGQPAIAGAVQNDESVTFLILTATIQTSDSNSEK